MSLAELAGPTLRKPPWIRVRLRSRPEGAFLDTRDLMRRKRLNTVCEQAACPNIGECWAQKHVTVMILGDVCTRACAFCNVKTGRPDGVDYGEPIRLGEAVAELGLRHVVITSVDRDDLADGGAHQFARCVEAVRRLSPGTSVEVLTPDFRHKDGALEVVAAARPDVFNHNVETVPGLYPRIRPGASYEHSVAMLRRAKQIDASVFTKSGMMLGLGETRDEVLSLMDDLRCADVDFITIGQYLRPSPRHAAVERYWSPEEFVQLGRDADERGFLMVSASPMTRSSYHADSDFEKLCARRAAAS